MMKKFFCLLVLCTFWILPSCIKFVPHENPDAIAEFAQYPSAHSAVVVMDYENIYFETHTLKLRDLVPDAYPDFCMVYEDRIIFAACVPVEKEFVLQIYECDWQGNGLKKLFEKDGYQMNMSCIGIDGVVYIGHNTTQWYDQSSAVVDSYTVATGEYKRVAEGYGSSVSDFVSAKHENAKYTGSVVAMSDESEKYFLLCDKQTGKTKTVGEEFLSKTEYAVSLEKFKCMPKQVDIIGDRIYLVYSVTGAEFPYLVFSYDFETEILRYEVLAFLYDSVPVSIHTVLPNE